MVYPPNHPLRESIYGEDHFLEDLSRLPVTHPNPTLLSIMGRMQGVHDEICFFGGEAWESCTIDLEEVEADRRSDFLVWLFPGVLLDQHLFSNVHEVYAKWRSNPKHKYHKFGRAGLGPHIQHPYWILLRPVETGIVTAEDISARLGDALRHLTYLTQDLTADERGRCWQTLLAEKALDFRQDDPLVHSFRQLLHTTQIE
jgi:hypothetical protein